MSCPERTCKVFFFLTIRSTMMEAVEMTVSSLNEYGVQLSTLMLERMNFEMEYLSSTLTVFDPQIRSRFYESSIKLVLATKEFVSALITFLFYISLIFIKLFTLALPYVSFNLPMKYFSLYVIYYFNV